MFYHLYWFVTQGKFFLFWNSNIYVIKLESESAMQEICNRFRNRNPPTFGRIAILENNQRKKGFLCSGGKTKSKTNSAVENDWMNEMDLFPKFAFFNYEKKYLINSENNCLNKLCCWSLYVNWSNINKFQIVLNFNIQNKTF